MKPERWEQIEQLYHAALERAPAEREVLLVAACSGDEPLRRQVAALLAQDDSAFIKTPALNLAARNLAADEVEREEAVAQQAITQQLGAYQLLAPLGRGGMGEVFLAFDARLQRKVAIKLLPAAFTADAERVRRFAQEARAASALNHPNIITIHEIGQSANTHYLVTELVEGETLRQRLRNAPQQRFSLTETVAVAAQIAEALVAAHKAGIIHRDIKPENVMIRQDGYVKVLDFGLAKLTERKNDGEKARQSDDDPALPLHPGRSVSPSTETGVVMGTPRYMSPEQARGEKVDARTDLFSLGAVLYEMVAGQPPFAGASSSEILAAILRDAPLPLTTYAPATPSELQRIVTQTLQKNRDARYQAMAELLADLKRLQRQLERQDELPDESRVLEEETTALLNNAAASPTQDLQLAQSTNEQVTTDAGQAAFFDKLKRHKLALALTLVIVLAAVSVAVYRSPFIRRASAMDSLAVLPFVNVGANPDTEYLSDGISESLINSLSQLPGLKVIARSSSFRYKGKDTDPQEVSRLLGVAAIVSGRVLQREGQLQISVELMDARAGTHLWGEQYNRRTADLLAAQAELSGEIARQLRLKLTNADQQQLTKRETVNSEAYELILRGRAQREIGRPENLKGAVEFFKRAIALDPSYALAHAELSIIYGLLSATSLLNPKEYLPQAEAEARQALALDANLADAHYALANAEMNQLNWPAAGAAFERALALNPNLARARWRHALYLSIMGQHDQAIAEAERARELSPLSPRFKSYVSIMLMNAGRSDEAIKVLQNTLALDPNSREALTGLGYIYLAKGMYAESITAYQQSIKSGYAGMSTQIYLGAAYARAGERNKALAILKQLQTSREYVSPCELAVLYIALDQREEAFTSLERAYAERDAGLGALRNERGFDPIRSDPRFINLMRRVGLPQ